MLLSNYTSNSTTNTMTNIVLLLFSVNLLLTRALSSLLLLLGLFETS